MMSANCRTFHGFLLAMPILLAGGLALRVCAAESRSARCVPLLDDTRLEQGVIVWSPEAGSHRRQGVLRGLASAKEPVWGLAQWHSRYSLADATPEPLAAGGLRYCDAAKSITFFAADSPADFALAVRGSVEYDGQAPAAGDPWPHLLAERKLLVQPALGQLEAVPFAVRYRLVESQRHTPEGFDERRHTAQFVFYLTVQNLNRNSAGFGDYYWFGVPLYDARYRLPRAHKAVDVGSDRKPATGKFIFNPPGEVYTRHSAHDGEWVTIEKDLLPLIREGLETAWQRGYLGDSRNWADYHLVAMNTGWEVTGPWDVEMQVSGLRLLAQLQTEDTGQDASEPQQAKHKQAKQEQAKQEQPATPPDPLWNGPALPADPTAIPFAQGIEHRTIHRPTADGYKFLHGAAIVFVVYSIGKEECGLTIVPVRSLTCP